MYFSFLQHPVRSRLASVFLAALMALSLSLPMPAQAQMPDYAYYYNQGNAYYEKGELTKAIEMYEKAIPLAKGPSLPIAYNNLAAIYMRRGNYVLSSLKQPENALSDFRRAYYLMEYGWPEGMDHSSNQETNRQIARDNVKIGYENLRIAANDKKAHIDMAKKLRLRGKFHEAIVEFGKIYELDNRDAEALKALGDLFNVLNRPEKSKKYYTKAVDQLGDRADDRLLVRLAIAQNKAGEVDNAVESLNKALAVNPNNMDAVRQLEDIWRRDIKFNPRSVLGHANLASVFQKKKMFGDALKAYDTAEQLASRDPSVTVEVKKQIRLNMGTLYQEMKDFEMAHKAYDTVLQIDPQNKQATYYKAVLYKEAGQVAQAIEQYNRLLVLDPSYEDAHDDLLKLIKRQPNPTAIASGLKDYANRYPSNALVQSKVGEEFHAMKDYRSAEVYYRRAIQLKPDLPAAHANLGAALQAMGNTSEAVSHFKKAAELDPNNQRVASLAQDAETAAGHELFKKAVELQQQGKNEEALPYYEKALKIPANDTPEFRASYGISLQNLGRYADAIRQYEEALKKAPDNGNYHFYLATAYHQDNNLPRAVSAYHKAMKLSSTDSAVRSQAEEAVKGIDQAEAANILNKAVDAYNRRAYAQSLNLIDKALKKNPSDPMAYYYQALVYKEQKKLPQSVNSYQSALKYDPDFKDAYYGLGVALDEKQDKIGAKNAFQKYIDLSNGAQDDFVKYAQDRVNAL